MTNIEKIEKLKTTLAGLTLSKPQRDFHTRKVFDENFGKVKPPELDRLWNEAATKDTEAFDRWANNVRLVESAIKIVSDQITVEKALQL